LSSEETIFNDEYIQYKNRYGFFPTYNIENFLRYVKESKVLSNTNKAIVEDYITSMELGEASKNTLMYNMKIIKFVVENITNDLDKLTFQDIDKLRSKLLKFTRKDGSKVSDVTKKHYKIGIKRFLYWYAKGHRDDLIKYDHYTRLAERVTENDIKKKNKEDPDNIPTEHIFTQTEIDQMIKVADTTRDKAIIITLAESGCRLGELTGCKIEDFKLLPRGCELKFRHSKTNPRVVPLIEAAGYIDRWIKEHPLHDNPDAALWVKEHGKHNAIKDCTIYSLVRRVAKKAGIEHRAHPHMFRHSCATQLARENTNPEAMKQFLGWDRKSAMPSLYTHLSKEDLKNIIFKSYGVGPVEVQIDSKGKRIGKCPKCRRDVSVTSSYCSFCGEPLSEDMVGNINELAQSLLRLQTAASNNNLVELQSIVIKMITLNK